MPKPSLPSKKVKDKILPLRVSTEDIKFINALMKSYNLSASQVLRKGLEDLANDLAKTTDELSNKLSDKLSDKRKLVK
jgi:hypothetical protein